MDETRFFSLTKKERIDFLEKQGFNVPKFIIKISSFNELLSFKKSNFLLRFSFRTQPREGRGEMAPHFPNAFMSGDFFKKLAKVVRTHDLLVYEPIDPSLCLKRGNILVDKESRTFLIEYLTGPGTVREMESASFGEIRTLKGPLLDWKQRENEEQYLILGISPSKIISIPFKTFILEFSEYKVPVGIKKMNGIFWEIRKG